MSEVTLNQASTDQATQNLPEAFTAVDRQMLVEAHEFSRKAKNYMKWQLIITVALVVIPLIASIIIIPYTLNSLGSAYGLGSLGGGTTTPAPGNGANNDLMNQLKQLQQ